METLSKETLKRTLNRIMDNPDVFVRIKIDGKFQDVGVKDVIFDKDNNSLIIKTNN